MPRRSTGLVVFISMLLFSFSAYGAAADYYLKIDGVDGESKDDAHKNWLELQSFSWGAANKGTQAGGGCNLQDFHFVIKQDKSTPKLRSIYSSNRMLPQVIVEVQGERHLIQNAKITSFTPKPVAGSLPMEEVSFNFAKCETHAAAAGPAGHKHKVELKISQNPVRVGLLLPAVQKVREAAHPQASLDSILIGLSVESPGKGQMVVQGGSEAAGLLQRAFQTQQKLDFMEITRKEQPYTTIKFTDVLITSFQPSGVGVKMGLNFKTIEGNPAAFPDVSYK